MKLVKYITNIQRFIETQKNNELEVIEIIKLKMGWLFVTNNKQGNILNAHSRNYLLYDTKHDLIFACHYTTYSKLDFHSDENHRALIKEYREEFDIFKVKYISKINIQLFSQQPEFKIQPNF